VGGVWEYTATLTRVLAAEGHAVLLTVLGDPDDERLAGLPRGVAVEARPFKLEWMEDAGSDIGAAAEWLSRLAQEWRADLVHLNQLAHTGVATFPAPTVVVVHSDVCSWFDEVRGEDAPARWKEYTGWVHAGLRGANCVVAPTAYQADLTRRHYAPVPIRVLHNGTPSHSPPARKEQPALVLGAGRGWDEAKGLTVLDTAIRGMESTAPATHWLGSLRSPGGAEVHAGSLDCHGYVPKAEVADWMRRATHFVSPSLYEPFGLAPLEAAFHGCTLILSDIGSFRELWDGAAAFFPKGDARSLALLLEELSRDPGESDRLARAAHDRASANFSEERFGERYLSLYHALTGAGRLISPVAQPSDPGPTP